MSEREELEAVIEGYLNASDAVDWIEGDLFRNDGEAKRGIATALINSGYTKGNGELVEAVRLAHRVKRLGEMSAALLRDPVRTGNWEGAEKTARQFDRFADLGEKLERALSDSEEAVPSGRSGGDAAGRDVLAERARQRAVEGWSPEHDDEHLADELVGAAICYAATPAKQKLFEHFDGADLIGLMWPIGWDFRWFKPKGRRRDLVRASALIIAEIERLDRAAARSAAQDTQRAERATNGELHGDGVGDDTEAVQERVNAGLTIGDSHE